MKGQLATSKAPDKLFGNLSKGGRHDIGGDAGKSRADDDEAISLKSGRSCGRARENGKKR
jgi:hypothetical protein